MTKLPKWLTDEFPEHDDIVRIEYVEASNKFVVSSPNNPSYDTIEEAYDAVEAPGVSQVIDKSCDGHGGKLSGRHFWFSTADEKTGTARLLTSGSSTKNSVSVLKNEYGYFLELTKEYDANPDDFTIAYNWLDRHPAFWTRQKNEKTFDWNTQWVISDCFTWVGRDDNGKTFVNLETGGWVENDYTHRYHDMRLDVSASTMEKAYVKLAKKVRKFFDLEGYSLEVPYKKSKAEEHLDEVLSNYEKRNK